MSVDTKTNSEKRKEKKKRPIIVSLLVMESELVKELHFWGYDELVCLVESKK